MLGRVVSGLGNGINHRGRNRACQILMMTRHDFGYLRCIPGGGNPRFWRGKMSVIVVLHNVVFYMIGSWLTLATSYMPNDGQWRVPFALQVSL